jgi:beta-galactosidase
MAISLDASQHWRSWLDGTKVRFLVAGFITAGNELFLGSYYAPTQIPLEKGDVISNIIKLKIN